MELEAEFEIRLRVTAKDIDEYNTLSAALLKAIETTVRELTNFSPVSMSVNGMLPYPEAIFRFGSGRVR